MLKCNYFLGKGGANHHPQRTSNTICQGQGPINYDNDDDNVEDDDDDDDDDDNDDYDVFS